MLRCLAFSEKGSMFSLTSPHKIRYLIWRQKRFSGKVPVAQFLAVRKGVSRKLRGPASLLKWGWEIGSLILQSNPVKAGDMNRWDWLTRDFTTTKQATNFLKTHTIVWEYSNGGSLYSGSDCILDVWLARKTENTISIYNGDLLHQDIRREKRWQEVSTSHQAGEIKVTFSEVQETKVEWTMVGRSCGSWSHGGDPAVVRHWVWSREWGRETPWLLLVPLPISCQYPLLTAPR